MRTDPWRFMIMPSPFPGMDPYLEDPAVWPDFNHRFATILSEELNDQLPAPFYAHGDEARAGYCRGTRRKGAVDRA